MLTRCLRGSLWRKLTRFWKRSTLQRTIVHFRKCSMITSRYRLEQRLQQPKNLRRRRLDVIRSSPVDYLVRVLRVARAEASVEHLSKWTTLTTSKLWGSVTASSMTDMLLMRVNSTSSHLTQTFIHQLCLKAKWDSNQDRSCTTIRTTWCLEHLQVSNNNQWTTHCARAAKTH